MNKKTMIVFVLLFVTEIKLISMDPKYVQAVVAGYTGAVIHEVVLVGSGVYSKKVVYPGYADYGKSTLEKTVDRTAVLTTAIIAGYEFGTADSLSVELLIVPALLVGIHIIGRRLCQECGVNNLLDSWVAHLRREMRLREQAQVMAQDKVEKRQKLEAENKAREFDFLSWMEAGRSMRSLRRKR